MASAAFAGGGSPATTDLRALEASYEAQQDALSERQELELARLNEYWAQKVLDRRTAAATEQAELQRQMKAAVALVLVDRDARLVDVEARRKLALDAAEATHTAKQAEKEAWVAEYSTDLSPDAEPLSDDEAENVKAEIETDGRAEVEASDEARKAALDPLRAQYQAAVLQAEADLVAFVAAQESAARALADSYKQQVADAKTELSDRLAELDDEKATLEVHYKATEDALKAQSKESIAAAEEAGDDAEAIEAAWEARLDELDSLHELQMRALDDQIDATKDASKVQLDALKDAYEEQEDYQAEVDEAELAKFAADNRALLLSLSANINATEAAFKAQKKELKAIFRVEKAADLKPPHVLAHALEKVVTLVGKQHEDAVRGIEERLENERNIIALQATNEIALAEIPFRREIRDSQARLDDDLVNVEADHENAYSALERRHLREALLASIDYKILRKRTEKYLDSSAGATIPLDNFYDPASDGGSLFNVAKTIGADHTELTGAGVKVALLDTGVAPVDGLAQANVILGPDFSFEDLDDDARGVDTNGHGTHLAGIIVGSDDAWLAGDHERDESRSLGIAPDAQLVAIKAATAAGATDVSQVIAGINWVIRYNEENPTSPIRVLNLAYGTDSEQDYSIDPLSYAVERAWLAGIVVVVAAGNDGWDSSHLTNPGRDPYVIAVGASQEAGDKTVVAGYSSEGSPDRGVDLVAPGRSIVSLRNPGSFSDTSNGKGRVGDRLVRGSGTSQATAVVSGAVALLLEDRPELTPDQVKTLLMATADEISSGDPRVTGAGVLDIHKALQTGTIYTPPQSWAPSDGSGSLEAARGSSHIPFDDHTLLIGETDIFGNSYAEDGWATDEWTGRTWRASGWEGRSWRADDWEGRSWRADNWYGRSWRGDSWEGRSWRADDWEGRSWRADRWEGRSWRGDTWVGRSWRADDWEGRSWRGFGAY